MSILTKLAGFKYQLIAGGVALALIAGLGFTISTVAYNKGLNVSKVEIQKYEGKVKDLNTKLVIEQGKITTKIVTQYVDRYIEREKVIYKNRDVIVSSVPEQFTFSKGWIYAHNQSALDKDIDPKLAANAESSGVTDRSGLSIISDNNGICNQNADQLEALQEWIRQNEKATNSITLK